MVPFGICCLSALPVLRLGFMCFRLPTLFPLHTTEENKRNPLAAYLMVLKALRIKHIYSQISSFSWSFKWNMEEKGVIHLGSCCNFSTVPGFIHFSADYTPVCLREFIFLLTTRGDLKMSEVWSASDMFSFFHKNPEGYCNHFWQLQCMSFQSFSGVVLTQRSRFCAFLIGVIWSSWLIWVERKWISGMSAW